MFLGNGHKREKVKWNGSVYLVLQKTAFLKHESEYDREKDTSNRQANNSCDPVELRQHENMPHKMLHFKNVLFLLDLIRHPYAICRILFTIIPTLIQHVNYLVGH